MRIGDTTIDPVSDGVLWARPSNLYSNAEEDWAPHRQFLNDRGFVEMEMGGFLVRSGERVVLIDTGIGPHGMPGRTGTFMESLAAHGVAPAEVTDVVLTHLHFDHVGWSSDGERPLFPHATYRCHEDDWDFFVGADPYDEAMGLSLMGGRPASENLPPVAGRLETWTGDATLVPGLDVRSAPGHTPGSTVVIVSSGTERAVLLGDVVHCPVELLSDDWAMIGDVDGDLARRSRETLARELEGTDIPVSASHFPGMAFGRLLRAEGRRRWVFD